MPDVSFIWGERRPLRGFRFKVMKPEPPISATIASVLIVEDDPAIRQLMGRFLAGTGHDLAFAADAHAALSIAARMQPMVVLADVHLQDSANGLWLLDRVRERCPTTAMILATGDSGVPPTESLRPGVVAYLVKPVQLADVLRAVEDGIAWSMAEASRRGTGSS